MSILWHLSDTNRTFRQLQERCDNASPTVVNSRLKELRAAQLVTKTDTGYSLTAHGRALYDFLEPLDTWAEEWAAYVY